MQFRVFGIPKAQPRPKVFRRGNHVGVYDPGTAAGWKKLIQDEARKIWSGHKLVGPLHVTVGFIMPRPKSHLKGDGSLRKQAPIHCISKPDVDNLAKAVLDALTDLGVWRDDSEVCFLDIGKVYGKEPGVIVSVLPACDTSHIVCAV
jgi:Holliday junction resolvase RusA-like endonuclease